jgi:SAM-dependent methyltransferase
MRLFPNDELRYYFFGLQAGLKSLRVNRLQLGLRKTLGKITQPINAPSRFPEYHRFASVISGFIRESAERPVRILDVGSPKLLGLYLGHATRAALTLTDITDLNLAEYRLMWRALQPAALGNVDFSLQDARALQFGAATFDVVYSMSVLEHVEGEAGDTQAVAELLRVLKPGGLLVLSVPFGSTYVEQTRLGVVGAARRTGDRREYFFQRIYDERAFRRRILAALGGLIGVEVTTVARRHAWLARGVGRLGENVRGALGFMNPVLSMAINTSRAGIDHGFVTHYGTLHSASDVYGDLILSGRRREGESAGTATHDGASGS